MKRILLALFFLTAHFLVESQIVTPQILSTAGTSFINGNNSLEWTLGEVATFTLSNNTNLLTQGFHQNNLIIEPADSSAFVVLVTPNPTSDFIQIRFYNDTLDYNVKLFSIDGKVILSKNVKATSMYEIDMSNYASSNYLLKITIRRYFSKEKYWIKSFKILKR